VTPVILDSSVPFNGPVTGDTNITITGATFVATQEITVMFSIDTSQFIVPGVFIDSSHISCVSPNISALFTAANANITVALNGQQYSKSMLSYYFYGMLTESIVILIIDCSCSGCASKRDAAFWSIEWIDKYDHIRFELLSHRFHHCSVHK